MNKNKIEFILKQFDGLSSIEWAKIKYLIDNSFNKKQREFEDNLKLSDSDIQNVIRELFE